MSFIRAMFGRPKRGAMNLSSLFDLVAQTSELGFPLRQTLTGDHEEMESHFASLVSGAYAGNGIVFATVMTKYLLFSEARFQFQQLRGGTPGNLFGTSALSLLERPEPGKTTGDLLARQSIDSDFAGNGFLARRPAKNERTERIKRMRPDWVSIALGSNDPPDAAKKAATATSLDAEVIGYAYVPGGFGSGNEPVKLLPSEVSHFAPIPDPLAQYRGMSPVVPVIRNVLGDKAATSHKLNYFRNGATANMLVTLPDSLNPDEAQAWIDLFEQDHQGVANAFRTIYFAGGASAESVGANLKDLDYKAVVALDETRIAAAIGSHPVVAALSEGMQGSSLNAGNFQSAARLMADAKLRPLWRNMAGSLENIVDRPRSTRLWYDDRDVPFLREDAKVRAEVMAKQAGVISTLFMAGAEWDAIVGYVKSGDLDQLIGQHTGLASVQLTPIGAEETDLALPEAAFSFRPVREGNLQPTDHNQELLAQQEFQATEDFWPSSGPFAGREVRAGQRYSGMSALVVEFPSMFEPTETVTVKVSKPGPGYLLTDSEIRSKQRELVAAGKPAGYASVAKELRVHRDTVRRRLNGHSKLDLSGTAG